MHVRAYMCLIFNICFPDDGIADNPKTLETNCCSCYFSWKRFTVIQSTFYLYLGGGIASLVLSYFISGGIKPPFVENATWWMWLPGVLGTFYVLIGSSFRERKKT